MNALKSAYINEIYKISKKKKLIVAAALSVGAVIVCGLIFSGINYIAGIKVSGGANFAISVLPFLQHTIIALFTAFVCIDMFSGEFGDKTIKLALTRPVSRFKIYLAKALAGATFIIAFLIFSLMCAIIVSLFTDGIETSIFKPTAAYILSFFPLMVFALLVMFVSNFSRGSASAFLISIVLFLAFKGAEFMTPAYKSFFFTSSFDWYKLFFGAYVNIFKIVRILLIFLGYMVFLFTCGYALFEKRNF